MKQVIFYDKVNDERHGGILTDEGNLICGCCGSVIPADEIGEEHDYQLLIIFDTWVNLDEEICGDVLLDGR